MIEEIIRETIAIVSWAMICGWFIKDAITGFKKEEYFRFGTELALAIAQIVQIIKYIMF